MLPSVHFEFEIRSCLKGAQCFCQALDVTFGSCVKIMGSSCKKPHWLIQAVQMCRHAKTLYTLGCSHVLWERQKSWIVYLKSPPSTPEINLVCQEDLNLLICPSLCECERRDRALCWSPGGRYDIILLSLYVISSPYIWFLMWFILFIYLFTYLCFTLIIFHILFSIESQACIWL